MKRRLRTAFTLIELLVVIAIIAVLIALLLPAIQSAREAANRTECKNKMKQFGLALNSYHDVNNTLPPLVSAAGQGSCPGSGNGTAARAPYSVALLPFLDQQELFDRFNLSRPFSSNEEIKANPIDNHAIQKTPVAAFHCPSDPNAPNSFRSNYFAVTGGGPPGNSGCQSSNTVNFILYTNGVMFVNSNIRLTDVLDGTSKTYMMGESKYMVHANGPGNAPVKYAFWSAAPYLDASWRYYTNMAAAVEPINRPIARPPDKLDYNPRTFYSEAPVGRTFGSFHPGGCHMLMCDGSVNFFSELLDVNVHRALGTREGNEVVTSTAP